MVEPRRSEARATLMIKGLDVYYGRSRALQGVDLTLEQGVLSVVGRNGMGKTTLCNAIMGLVRASGGAVRMRGEELLGLPPAQIARRGVGYVPQGRRLWRSLTVDEHLRMTAARRRGAWTVERVYATFPRLAERRNSGGGQLLGRGAADAGDLARAGDQSASPHHGRADRRARARHRRSSRRDADQPRRGKRHCDSRHRAKHRRGDDRIRQRRNHGQRADQPHRRIRAGSRPIATCSSGSSASDGVRTRSRRVGPQRPANLRPPPRRRRGRPARRSRSISPTRRRRRAGRSRFPTPGSNRARASPRSARPGPRRSRSGGRSRSPPARPSRWSSAHWTRRGRSCALSAISSPRAVCVRALSTFRPVASCRPAT